MKTPQRQGSRSHRALVRTGRFFVADEDGQCYLFVDGDIVWMGGSRHGPIREIVSIDLNQGLFRTIHDGYVIEWQAEPYTCTVQSVLEFRSA